MKKLVVGNWKMHGSTAMNATLVGALNAGVPSGVDVGVCVPFPYLAQVRGLLSPSVALGAQNVSDQASGAFTGEVSAAMLKELGCRYVLVGHSERRSLYGETDAIVAAKSLAALNTGLAPIVCVGETLAEREGGQTLDVIRRQLDAVAAKLDASKLAKIVIAYEPVWAIGTGRSASKEQAQEVHAAIRSWLKKVGVSSPVSVLYGGSVKPANAAELFAMPDIDGGLIGGASLVAADFLAICAAGTLA